MTTSLLSLPPELHEKIFFKLATYLDLFSCLLICRALFPEAERVLYGRFLLGSVLNHRAALGALTRIVNTPHLAQHLKELIITPELEKPLVGTFLVPWPMIYQSAVNLRFLSLSHSDHLAYIADYHPFHLQGFTLTANIASNQDCVARLTTFLQTQSGLKRLAIWDEDVLFPQEIASNPNTFLPQIQTLLASDRLAYQLFPGRRITWAHINPSYNMRGALSPFASGALQTLTVVNIGSLALFSSSYASLKYLRCIVDWVGFHLTN